jgi:hypothetical protein
MHLIVDAVRGILTRSKDNSPSLRMLNGEPIPFLTAISMCPRLNYAITLTDLMHK